MGTHDYDPERFGRVLATLEAQNVVLAGLHDDVNKIYGLIYAIQKERSNAGTEWIKILASAGLGAVCYFTAQKFMG